MDLVVAVLLFYVVPATLLGAPVLLVRSRRQLLAKGELTVLLYPALIWLVLLAGTRALKGQTNAEVELFALALLVGCSIHLRVRTERLRRARLGALFLPLIAGLGALLVFAAVPPFTHYDLLGAWLYARKHPELPPPTRAAILQGVVLEGMTIEGAQAAGGPFSWVTEDGKLERMTFNNLSQFGGARPAGFVAHVVDGRVHDIERLDDTALCEGPNVGKDSEYPLVGFWRRDCAQNFGLRLGPGSGGRYAIRFCGPGGCGNVLRCTSLPARDYMLPDTETLVVRRGTREETYRRCAP